MITVIARNPLLTGTPQPGPKSDNHRLTTRTEPRVARELVYITITSRCCFFVCGLGGGGGRGQIPTTWCSHLREVLSPSASYQIRFRDRIPWKKMRKKERKWEWGREDGRCSIIWLCQIFSLLILAFIERRSTENIPKRSYSFSPSAANEEGRIKRVREKEAGKKEF